VAQEFVEVLIGGDSGSVREGGSLGGVLAADGRYSYTINLESRAQVGLAYVPATQDSKM
jgi:hypothetical protein